jgi:hypothetical protein
MSCVLNTGLIFLFDLVKFSHFLVLVHRTIYGTVLNFKCLPLYGSTLLLVKRQGVCVGSTVERYGFVSMLVSGRALHSWPMILDKYVCSSSNGKRKQQRMIIACL